MDITLKFCFFLFGAIANTKGISWLVRISHLLTFWRIKHVLFIDSQLETHSLRLRKKNNTGRNSLLSLILSACISPSVFFLFYLSCSGAPLLSFLFHVMRAEAKRAPVMNVNVGPPFSCSPKLQQPHQPPPPHLSLHSLRLSAFTHNASVGLRTLINRLSAEPPAAHLQIQYTDIRVRPDK